MIDEFSAASRVPGHARRRLRMEILGFQGLVLGKWGAVECLHVELAKNSTSSPEPWEFSGESGDCNLDREFSSLETSGLETEMPSSLHDSTCERNREGFNRFDYAIDTLSFMLFVWNFQPKPLRRSTVAPPMHGKQSHVITDYLVILVCFYRAVVDVSFMFDTAGGRNSPIDPPYKRIRCQEPNCPT